jgi:hypothetical protein
VRRVNPSRSLTPIRTEEGCSFAEDAVPSWVLVPKRFCNTRGPHEALGSFTIHSLRGRGAARPCVVPISCLTDSRRPSGPPADVARVLVRGAKSSSKSLPPLPFPRTLELTRQATLPGNGSTTGTGANRAPATNPVRRK